MNKNAPIGIFDSGIGGLSIWKEIIKKLPFENTIYLADNKNAPYGIKSKEQIIAFSIKNTKFLLEQGAKIIVVACNTATTNAIKQLRKEFPDIHFIGVEPAIKPAALNSKTKKIAVLATYNTLRSKSFKLATQKNYMKDVEILSIAGIGLVDLIESGEINSSKLDQLLDKYLEEVKASKNIDYLVLGCTHYPFLNKKIKEKLAKNITLIDSGIPVANQTKYILTENSLLNESKELGNHQLYYNADKTAMQYFVEDSDRVKILYKEF